MLGSHEHALFVIDADGGVEIRGGRRVDADDRDVDAFELFDLVRVDGERVDEYGVDVAADRQSGEELLVVLGCVDVLEQGDVISGIVKDVVDSGEDFGVEPAGDLLVHQERDTVCLAGFQSGGGAGDVEVQLVRGTEHFPSGFLRYQLWAREGARNR